MRCRELRTLGVEASLEHVADGVKNCARSLLCGHRGVPPISANHELRKGRPGKRPEWDLRLPRHPLAHRCPRGLEREVVELDAPRRKAERAHEPRPVDGGVCRAGCELLELLDVLLDHAIPADEPECRRLDHGQGPNRGRVARGREQSDNGAVRVADEVCALRQECRDVVGVSLEVDAPLRRRAPETAPVDEQQLEVVGQWSLRGPRLLAPAEAPVDEHNGRTVAPPRHVEFGHGGQPYNRRVDLDLVFLGTSGSMPTAQRAPAAILVRRGGDRLLIDCAEGTQRQLLRSSVGLVELAEIFLTHFHADHVLGLPGMLKTFALRGRELPLVIYGPRGLVELMTSLKRVVGKLSYDLRLVELAAGDALERDGYRLATFGVSHGVTALGWSLIELTRPGRFDVAAADALGVAPVQRGELQRGMPVTVGNRRIVPEEVLGPPRPGRKIVLTGDTAPSEAIIEAAWHADVLVTEATFLEEERERAQETSHQTALQAAGLARRAEVGLLALTHLSNRYFGPEIAHEASEVFPETVVPRDFDVIEVPFAERGNPQLIRDGARHHRAPDAVSSAAQ